MKSLGVGLFVVLGLTGCGASSSEEETSSSDGTTISEGSGKLSLDELAAPTDFPAMTRSDVISHMEGNRWDFLATEAEATTEEVETSEDDPACMNDPFGAATIAAEGETLTANVNIDLLSCFKTYFEQEQPDVTVDLSKMTMSVYISQTCVGGDLSAFNGKKVTEIESVPECDKNLMLVNFSSETVGSVSNEGRTIDISAKTVNAVSTASNEACVMTKDGDNYSEDDGCIEISKSVSPDVDGSNDYVKYTHKNLKWVTSDKNSWYTSGRIDVNLNAWSGSVTFRGADINPLYTMKYGADTINGTLTVPASSLSLKVKAMGQDMIRNARILKKPR